MGKLPFDPSLFERLCLISPEKSGDDWAQNYVRLLCASLSMVVLFLGCQIDIILSLTGFYFGWWDGPTGRLILAGGALGAAFLSLVTYHVFRRLFGLTHLGHYGERPPEPDTSASVTK